MLSNTDESEEDQYRILIIAVSTSIGAMALIIIIVILVFHRLNRRSRPAMPIKKRVVVMRPNILYTGSGGMNYKDMQASFTPLIPRVRIEGGRGRLSSDLTTMSEYEIPLDEDWEFPRDR